MNDPSPASQSDAVQSDFATSVQWRMAHDRNPLFPLLQDKLAVKGYARERGVASADVFAVISDPALVPRQQFPDTCFVKANHGCGWNFLREKGVFYYFGNGNELMNADGSLNDAARRRLHVPHDQVVQMCMQMFSLRYCMEEWAYQMIRPQIFIEEKLLSAEGGELLDYRFYTFDGVVKAINVGSATYRRKQENVFLTPDWQVIAMTQPREGLPNPLPKRPEQLPAMISAAERLGSDIDFVRIDLYQSTKGVMLGEMTLYPNGGAPRTPSGCPRFDQWLGQQWRRPEMPTVARRAE